MQGPRKPIWSDVHSLLILPFISTYSKITQASLVCYKSGVRCIPLILPQVLNKRGVHTPVLVDFCAEFLLVMSNIVHALANHSLFNSSLVNGPVGCLTFSDCQSESCFICSRPRIPALTLKLHSSKGMLRSSPPIEIQSLPRLDGEGMLEVCLLHQWSWRYPL